MCWFVINIKKRGVNLMEDMNIGGIEIDTRFPCANGWEVCIVCDYRPDVSIRPTDVCTCCDALDWSNRDA